jgi:hypothetical protein
MFPAPYASLASPLTVKLATLATGASARVGAALGQGLARQVRITAGAIAPAAEEFPIFNPHARGIAVDTLVSYEMSDGVLVIVHIY